MLQTNWLQLSQRIFFTVIPLVLFLLTACSLPEVGPPPEFVVPLPKPPLLEGANLLVIRGKDGNLSILNPESSERLELTDDASANVAHSQPVWSPTSAELAWVRTELQVTGILGEVLVADTEGNVKRLVETTYPPFYMYWNPQGTSLSLLGNWISDGAATIALNVVNANTTDLGELLPVDFGTPFYYAWAPDGERLVVHKNAHTVWVGPPQEPRLLTTKSAPFGAPVWLNESEDVVFAELRDGISTLVLRNLTTDAEEILTWYQNSHLALYADSSGKRLAVIETSRQIGINAFGTLFVYSIDKGTVEQITSIPVIAVFWSPDGQNLLYWEGNLQGGVGSFNLRYWDGKDVMKLALVGSPPEFLHRYLLFSDQYARSHTPWSADSRHIAFATVGAEGESEIFVQDVTAGTPPQWVAQGDLVFWSRHSIVD